MRTRANRDLARLYFEHAVEAHVSGNGEKAMDYYQRSIGYFPTAQAHTHLAWLHASQRDFARAVELCRTAIGIDPEYGNAWNDLGVYLMEAGDDAEALQCFHTATRAANYDSPHFPHINLARFHQKRGDWPLALDELQKAAAIKPDDPVIREMLGKLPIFFH